MTTASGPYRVSVDCGGTFTDGILLSDAHEVWAAKVDSTPQDPTVGTLERISRLAAQAGLALEALLGSTKTIVLGTTLATNIRGHSHRRQDRRYHDEGIPGPARLPARG